MQEKPEEREEAREREYVIRFRLPGLPRLLPEESRGHLRAARKEMLLAFRSMLDAAIERIEEKGKPEEKGPTKIEVE